MSAYANITTVIAIDGIKHRLLEGEVWAGDDPVVAARPDLFSDRPTKLRRSRPLQVNAPVEQATAAPGEKRTRKGSIRDAG